MTTDRKWGTYQIIDLTCSARTTKLGTWTTIGDIVSQVVLAIKPPLIKVVTSAAATAMRQLMTEMATKTAKRKAELFKGDPEVHKFELDRREKYSCCESIRILGIDEDTDNLGSWRRTLALRWSRKTSESATDCRDDQAARDPSSWSLSGGIQRRRWRRDQEEAVWRQQQRCLHQRRPDSSAC